MAGGGGWNHIRFGFLAFFTLLSAFHITISSAKVLVFEEDLPNAQDYRRQAVSDSGYEAIFLNLKGTARDWKARLENEPAMQIIARSSLDDSLLLLMTDHVPDRAGVRLDVPAAEAFCAAAIASDPLDSATIRRSGLCIARFPKLASSRLSGLLSAVLAKPADSGALQDAIFLFRVGRYCGCMDRAGDARLLAFLQVGITPFLDRYTACPTLRCAAFSGDGKYVDMAISRGALFAALEDPALLPDPAMRQLLWIGARNEPHLGFDQQSIEALPRRQCVLMELDYAECRRLHPYNIFAVVGLARVVANAVDRQGGGEARCLGTKADLAGILPDLIWQPDLHGLASRFLESLCEGTVGERY